MPRAGGTRRPKSGASAGGKGKPKAKGGKSRTIKDVKNTPPGKTSDTRNSNAREELESLIGLRICLITNMMTCPYLVHGIHVFERFENSVGRWTYDEEIRKWVKRVDLDSKGNYEFGENLDEFVARVKANPKMDYKELSPDGKHELIMYGFPNKHKHYFARYSTYQRSYRRTTPDGCKLTYEDIYQEYIDHQLDELEVERLILQTGDQVFVLVSHLNLVFVHAMKMKYRLDDPTGEHTDEETSAQESTDAEETDAQESDNAEEGPEFEESSDVEEDGIWEDIPEDQAYPSKTTVRRGGTQSEGVGQSAPIAKPPPRLARSAPEEPLGNQDSRGLDLSSDPPVDEDAIDEKVRMFLVQDNPTHSSTTIERRVHAASAYPSSDAGDPAVGPSQRNTHGTTRTSQQLATSSRSHRIRDSIAGKKTTSTNHKIKRTVRFLDDDGVGEHVVLPLAHQNGGGNNDDASRHAVPENPTNIASMASDDGLFTGNNSGRQLSTFEHLALNAYASSDVGVPDKIGSPAHSGKATTSTEAVASKSSGGRQMAIPARTSGRSVRFSGVGGRHRKANPSNDTIANQSARAASSAAPSTLSRNATTAPLPARSTAGHPSAISQATATSSIAAAASSSTDRAPAARPSQGKQTGDKRTRDDGEDDDKSDDEDDDGGLVFLPARRARKKVKAQDVNKSTARTSSNGASKKGGKLGK
ncbi:uncharacterized protein SCHCODRAFT_01167722 [Schizophyllum commune H4-8]|nr:uncharacterized protein SCHCODRAFT_01167722 [Schizophyllum commune H4-8]KAI5900759.1 hypothetical protein SCHCODRAFT_01167722 [Schizophyllum commune H4-8]